MVIPLKLGGNFPTNFKVTMKNFVRSSAMCVPQATLKDEIWLPACNFLVVVTMWASLRYTKLHPSISK